MTVDEAMASIEEFREMYGLEPHQAVTFRLHYLRANVDAGDWGKLEERVEAYLEKSREKP